MAWGFACSDKLPAWQRTIPGIVGRRFFQRAEGIRLGLLVLDALRARVLGSGIAISALSANAKTVRPLRMIATGSTFGFCAPVRHQTIVDCPGGALFSTDAEK